MEPLYLTFTYIYCISVISGPENPINLWAMCAIVRPYRSTVLYFSKLIRFSAFGYVIKHTLCVQIIPFMLHFHNFPHIAQFAAMCNVFSRAAAQSSQQWAAFCYHKPDLIGISCSGVDIVKTAHTEYMLQRIAFNFMCVFLFECLLS